MSSPVPPYARLWKQLKDGLGFPGVRLTFSTILDQMQQVAFRTKDFIVTNSGATTKFSLLWSASGGVGPANAADHTDRLPNAAAWTPRATVAAASQAFAVFTDNNQRTTWQASHAYVIGDYVTLGGNVYFCTVAGTSGLSGPSGTGGAISDGGVTWKWVIAGTGATQFMICFQGATDDISRISFSPGGLFTLAGTTNQQPTATDEQVYLQNTSLVNATASADRILHVWASDDGKAFRVQVFRSGVVAAPYWGLEPFVEGVQDPAQFGSPVWGFAYNVASLTAPAGTFSGNVRGGLARAIVSSVGKALQIQVDGRTIGSSVNAQWTTLATLQGSAFVPLPLWLSTSNDATANGPVGTPVDWYTAGPSGVADGDGFGSNYDWWFAGQILMPNPSLAKPNIA